MRADAKGPQRNALRKRDYLGIFRHGTMGLWDVTCFPQVNSKSNHATTAKTFAAKPTKQPTMQPNEKNCSLGRSSFRVAIKETMTREAECLIQM